MLFRWRRQLRAGLLNSTAQLLPVTLPPVQERNQSKLAGRGEVSDARVARITASPL
jgi:hypothetical protein